MASFFFKFHKGKGRVRKVFATYVPFNLCSHDLYTANVNEALGGVVDFRMVAHKFQSDCGSS